MLKKFLVILALVFIGHHAKASFDSLTIPELSCNNSSSSFTLNYIAGAPNGNYSATFTPSGDFKDLIKIGSAGYGKSYTSDFNIPSDESGLNIDIELDTSGLLEDFAGTTVDILVTPGDDTTSETGFGSTSGTVTISNDGCSITEEPEESEEVETECDAEFTTNGLQPVGSTFQDDVNFKDHTAVVGGLIAPIGGTVTYSVSENDAKELINDRQSLVLAREPNYTSINDLTEVSFVVTSKYSQDIPVNLELSASDSKGEVMNYKHPQVLRAPLGLPCQDEERVVTLTFKLNKVLRKEPKPPAFKFTTVGSGEVKGEVKKISDKTTVMTTKTTFNIANTSIGKIGILPIGNPKKPNVFGITRKLKKDARRLSNFLSRSIPDFLPLASNPVTTIELPFVSFNPVDVSNINDSNAKLLQINDNLKKVKKMINLSSESYIKSGQADVIISVFDSDTFSQINDGGAAAFAYVGSASSPGRVFVQTVKIKKPFRFGDLNQRTEDTIHEIIHSYGFVGSRSTTCPPVIHNVSTDFADSCRITKRTRVRSSCGIKRDHMMGPTVPKAFMSQCTYENMIDILKGIASSESSSQLKRDLSTQNGTESLLVQAFVSNGGESATIEPIYDSGISADSFLDSPTDTSWYFDLKNSGSSVSKLYFEFDFEDFAPESSASAQLFQKHIPLDDSFTSIDLVNSNGETIASRDFTDTIPTVAITKAELSKPKKKKKTKKKGKTLELEWTVTDSSGATTLSTVFIGPSADNLVAYGGAFETTEESVELSAINQDAKFVKVVVTNGSRSAESEVVEL